MALVAFLSNSIVSDYTASSSTFKALPWILLKVCSPSFTLTAVFSFVNTDLFLTSINPLQELNLDVCLDICAERVIPRYLLLISIKSEELVKLLKHIIMVLLLSLVFSL